MNFKNLMRKKERPITYDTRKLKKFITNWTKTGNWKFKDFEIFLKLIGLKMPVILTNLDKDACQIKGISDNKEFKMLLVFGDWIKTKSGIIIKEGEKTRRYEINKRLKGTNILPEIKLVRMDVLKRGKILTSNYSKNFCKMCLKIDSDNEISVEVYEMGRGIEEEILSKFHYLEEYLLKLEVSLVPEEVRKEIIKLLELDSKDSYVKELITVYYNKVEVK